jgi:hypothetical protein
MGQGVRLDGDLFRCLECEHLARYSLSEQDARTPERLCT